MSGGAGLLDEIRLPGRSILRFMPTLGSLDSISRLSRVNCPSLVLSAYMCTERSDD